MIKSRFKWKIAFFILCGLVAWSVYDVFTIPDIIAPSHPSWVSILMIIAHCMLLVSAFSYAYKQRILPITLVWKFVLFMLFFLDILVVYYEFNHDFNGYDLDEMAQLVIIKLFIFYIISLPLIQYIYQDLEKKE